MSITVDSITLRKLVLSKQLYQQAIIQGARRNASGRIIAIIGFDLSVETALKAVVGSLAPSKDPANGFQGLIQQADNLLSAASLGSVPNKPQIQNIHALRNDAQHKAKYPNDSDITASQVYTRDFLRAISNDLWEIDLDQISLADLIENLEVKSYLIRAERSLSNSSYRNAVQEAAYGLSLALRLVRKAVVGPELEVPTLTEGNLHVVITRMQEALLYNALGMNYGDFVRYRRIAGGVIFNVSSNGTIHPQGFGIKDNIDADEAEFVTFYCIDAVIENRVGGFKLGTIDGWY